MKIQVLSIRDRAADAYGQPMFFAALGKALRVFQDEINRRADDNSMYHHPEDFDLYHLGEYDDNNGKFTNLEQPKMISVGKDNSEKIK